MKSTDTKSPVHLVFIHGAWVSDWGWDGLIPYFADDAYQCHVIQLPDSHIYEASLNSQASMADYISHVSDVITAIGEPVYLVAHSGGGLTATGVAEALHEQVLGIIYVTGMMLPSGMSFGEICQKVAERGVETFKLAPYVAETQYGTKISLEGVKLIFLQDAESQVAEAVFNNMLVQPNASRLVSIDWTQQKAGRIPKYYIKAEQDQSVVPKVQDEMIAYGSPKGVASLNCGHFPQVVMPEALAKIIKGFVATGSA